MKMTFAGSIKSGLKNWSNFKGTATRTEFWYFYLFTVLLNMVTTTLDSIIAPGTDLSGAAMAGAGPLYLITNIALVLPNVSLAFRRFRDAGLSGSWLFLWALPFVAFNRKDDLQSEFVAMACGLKSVTLRQLYVPSSEGQVQAVLAGWGASVLPELKVREHLRSGTLINLMPEQHLDVALYWHCWNLNSAVLDALTHTLKSAAGTSLSANHP